jgi:hypothetical protein
MKTGSLLSHAALALAGAALTLAGCRSGGHGGLSSPTGGAPASAKPPTSAAASGSVAAYKGMWAAFVDAAKTSDPDAPSLRQYADGDALKLIVSDLYTNRQQGKVVKGDVVTSPDVASLRPADAPTEATIRDCVDDTHWLEYRKSGELWDNNPSGRRRMTATVRSTAGTWKVFAFTLEGLGTC